MTELSCIRVNGNLELIKHVKHTLIKNGQATDEVFQLRENRAPPEEYVSFFHSMSESIENKIQDMMLYLKKKKWKIKVNDRLLFLNASQASEEINLTNEIILFKECNYPHYGMYFLTENIMDIIEAKTILMQHSELYMCSELTKTDS